MSGWAHSSEGKEKSEEEGLGESWETESYGGRGEEEEDVRVPSMTPKQGARGRSCPIGGGWRIPGCRIQMQGDCHQRWGGTMALQEG